MNPPDLNTFDLATAWTLRDVIANGKLRGRSKRLSHVTIQKWANPNKGCLPIGSNGPRVVLPTVATSRERLTMPAWVEWFNDEVRRVMLRAYAKGGAA